MTDYSTTIWHIDDDELLLAVFSFVLEEAGFNVVAAGGQGEVQQLVTAAAPRPGLIMLDMDMPAVNGLETLMWLSGVPHLKDVPVVIVSSRFVTDERIQVALESGASGYISKARLNLERLPQIVRDHLPAAQKVEV